MHNYESSMDAKQHLKLNVGITAILTVVLGIVVITSNGGNVYFTWGPDENLHFVFVLTNFDHKTYFCC